MSQGIQNWEIYYKPCQFACILTQFTNCLRVNVNFLSGVCLIKLDTNLLMMRKIQWNIPAEAIVLKRLACFVPFKFGRKIPKLMCGIGF